MITKRNPIIDSDFPDPDIILVDDCYYMASTTMHYMPGCVLLRSYDLANWEWVGHVYDYLADTPEQNLIDGQIYGMGMWAPSFRYHKGKFYLFFASNDTRNNYCYIADNIEGPWTQKIVEGVYLDESQLASVTGKTKYIESDGFYHDPSLFFDDDDRIYVIYGQNEVWITELAEDLSGPKKDGLHRKLIEEVEPVCLGYEGCHMYKHNGRYYLFSCHAFQAGSKIKEQVCMLADSLDGQFIPKTIIKDDMGYHNYGVAQGGMIQTPAGEWYCFMFQDRGALGRAPMLMPMTFDEEGYPLINEGKGVPEEVTVESLRPEYQYAPLNADDDFHYEVSASEKVKLKPVWEFNHTPQNEYWSVLDRPGAYRIYAHRKVESLALATNTLAQRAVGPKSGATVVLDGSLIKEGDVAGLTTLQGCYGAIAQTIEDGQRYLLMLGKPAEDEEIFRDADFLDPAKVYAKIPISESVIKLKVVANFEDAVDYAEFFYEENNEWKKLGIDQKLYFKLDHFTGCYFGLFYFSTKELGGVADFLDFRYLHPKDVSNG